MSDPAIEAAARAYCAAKFIYDPSIYVLSAGAADHLAYDAESTAKEPWLAAVVAAVLDEAAKAIEAEGSHKNLTYVRHFAGVVRALGGEQAP